MGTGAEAKGADTGSERYLLILLAPIADHRVGPTVAEVAT